MRTTIALDDDVFERAKKQARLRGVSLGKTISDLARRGLESGPATEVKNGMVVFKLPADSPPVTTEHVRNLENDTL